VQAPGDFPREHRQALGDRLYGCDECTVVCPPSRLASRRLGDLPHGERPGPTVDVLEVLRLDDETLLERYGRWYLPGRDPNALRRNALVILGNTGDGFDGATAAVLERYLADESQLLAGHAAWAALALGRQDLAVAAADRPSVADELAAAGLVTSVAVGPRRSQADGASATSGGP